MFRNLLDKAKSAIDDVDNAIKLASVGNNAKQKKQLEYDSSYFTFQLEGGPIHSTKLIAVAKIKAGDKAGDVIPLTCKWFISGLDESLKQIEGVTGISYQPCTEDVGSRISVEATPVVEGAVYIGMPVYGEVGPLVLDKAVEEKVMGHLANEICEFRLNIEEIPFDVENKPTAFPIEGIITLNKQDKTLSAFIVEGDEKGQMLASCSYSDQYPSIEFIKRTPTMFDLQVSSDQVLKLSTETSLDRDVIATAIRMFGNEDFHNPEGNQEEEGKSVLIDSKSRKRNGSSNLEILMKREKLIKQIKQLEKDNLELKNEIKIEKESKANLETQITELIEQSAKNNEHTLKLEEEIEKFKNEKDTLLTESVYFVQEVNLYKSQNAQLEATIKNYEEEALKSKVSIEKERENMILEKMDTIKELQTKLTQNEIIIEQLQTEKEEMNAKITVLQDESESKDAVINSLQKKIQSLVEETKRLSNSKLIDLESSPMMKSAFSPQSFGSRILNEVESIEDNESPLKIKLESLKDIVKTPQKYEEEIKNLKQLNESLSNSIEKMKVSRESPTKKNFTLLGNPTKETAEYLQKLVVTLTEAIAEKDLSLENQKNLNKELGKKISELEQQLKFKETIN